MGESWNNLVLDLPIKHPLYTLINAIVDAETQLLKVPYFCPFSETALARSLHCRGRAGFQTSLNMCVSFALLWKGIASLSGRLISDAFASLSYLE
jgi:hypothetical protein